MLIAARQPTSSMIERNHSMNIYLHRIQSVSLPNKYTRWYVNIIQQALVRNSLDGYVEKHHILPRCFKMGGESDRDNLVLLTAREHFICHKLLTKMTNNKVLKLKLTCAVLFMAYGNGQTPKYLPPSICVAHIRESLSQLKTGTKGAKWTDKQRESLKGRAPHNKGVPMSEEAKAHLREMRKLQENLPHSADAKLKIGKSLKGVTKGWTQWNNGVISIKSIECPGEGWNKGCLKTTVKGMKWWTNGVADKRAHASPGEEWYLGRIFKYKKLTT